MHTKEDYWATEENEISPFATTQMDLEGSMLSEQTAKQKQMHKESKQVTTWRGDWEKERNSCGRLRSTKFQHKTNESQVWNVQCGEYSQKLIFLYGDIL